ncbi:MAG TPA: T9SS type A sorting domain-containing protein, partial [Bacteroidota bacterium]|nr:T9SS type A sorting domain-containing protein [Bacteroidota bacterium]
YDLIVQGTVSAASGFTVTRHITIMPGGTFNGGSGLTHTLGGNWTNNGTFNAGTSTIAFTGDSGQTIGGTTFYNIVLNDSLGAMLSGNVTLAAGGTCTLTRGNLSTGAYALAINNTDPAALVLGANTITGTVTRAIAPGSSAQYLLFGTNGYLVPSGSGNPTTITATVFPNTNPPNLPGNVDTAQVLKRYFTISAQGAGPAFSYTLCLPYAKSEVRGMQSIYSLWVYSGSGWTNVGTEGAPDTVNHYAVQTGLTAFGEWTLAENTAPLPIQLGTLDASAQVNPSVVQLNWTTVSEVNNYGFYVQRSAAPASGFADLPGNFISGSGTSLAAKHYQWVDRNPLPGTAYYRLKQVDLDGSFGYTQPVKVVSGASVDAHGPVVFALAQNYPNPFNPSTRINFSVDNAGYTTLKVYNILGEEVATLFAGPAVPGTDYSVSFDGSALANGAYFYRLTTADKTTLKKMVLLK